MTLRDLQKLVNDAIERGEDPNAVILEREPEGSCWSLGSGSLKFDFAEYTSDGWWERCSEGDAGAEPVAWFE